MPGAYLKKEFSCAQSMIEHRFVPHFKKINTNLTDFHVMRGAYA
jgi:hypothetical protein